MIGMVQEAKSKEDYEAEGYARTLIEAEEIKKDKKKFKRALAAMKKMREQTKKELGAMDKFSKNAGRM